MRPTLRQIAGGFAFAIIALAGPAAARDVTGPLEVTAFLEQPSLSLGEPIVARLEIRNTGQGPVTADLGYDRQGWLTLGMEDAAGRPVPAVKDHRPPPMGGLSRVPRVTLQPNETYLDTWVVTARVRPPKAGKHTAIFKVHIPYHLQDGETTVVQRFAAPDGTLDTTIRLPLNVAPADPSRLKKTADALLARIRSEKRVAELWTAIEALYSMPGEQVLPQWKAASGADPYATMRSLERYGSKEAIAVLADIYRRATAGTGERSMSGAALHNIWYQGDAEAKRHVEAAFLSADGKMPKSLGREVVVAD